MIVSYIVTGEILDGCKAAKSGLLDETSPREKLRERVRAFVDAVRR